MLHDEFGPCCPEEVKIQFVDGRNHRWVDTLVLIGVVLLALTMMVLAMLLLIDTHSAHAMDHGFDKHNLAVKWFETKIRPDDPPNSCCGASDAYPIARYIRHPQDHTVSIWLYDGSPIKYPDGATRDPFDEDVEIIAPDNKINPMEDDLDNPTNHGWIFFRPSTRREVGTIYCVILHPEGN